MANYNPFSLEGKTILVTGASSGIGKETAIDCSRMGATLVITGRNEERLKETFEALDGAERGHHMVIADLLVSDDMDHLVEETGEVDGMVLCAGRGLTLPFKFSTQEKFENLFKLNFFSPAELLRRLYKKKQINKNGSVVLIASLGGTRGFSGGNCIYGASKAALNSLMRFCAIEFAQRGIRVNSICPGMVETPLIHRGTITEEQLDEDKKRYPLKRYGQPADIANACIYLLSEASSWVTGQDLFIDGGVSI